MKPLIPGLAVCAAIVLAPVFFASGVTAVFRAAAAAVNAPSADIRVAQADAGVLKHGQELVTEKCGRCHGIGRGDTSRNLQAPPFRTLSKRYPVEALEEALGEGIISGHPDMPEFEFDSDDVGAIIAYLKSVQDK